MCLDAEPFNGKIDLICQSILIIQCPRMTVLRIIVLRRAVVLSNIKIVVAHGNAMLLEGSSQKHKIRGVFDVDEMRAIYDRTHNRRATHPLRD